MNPDTTVIVFLKLPEPGLAKTRLAAAIGVEAALALYREMVHHTMKQVMESGLNMCIHYAGSGDPAGYFPDLAPYSITTPQAGTDLGERMANSFESVFENGAESALLIGCDIPRVTARVLRKAAHLLDRADAVLGPAQDGGYYLIGLNRPSFHRRIFADIPWGTAAVLSETIHRLTTVGMKTAQLDRLSDIDTVDDLDRLIRFWTRLPEPENPVYHWLSDYIKSTETT